MAKIFRRDKELPSTPAIETMTTAPRQPVQIVDWHERVAERAYYLWQAEGCPAGQELHHWLVAEQELRRQK